MTFYRAFSGIQYQPHANIESVQSLRSRRPRRDIGQGAGKWLFRNVSVCIQEMCHVGDPHVKNCVKTAGVLYAENAFYAVEATINGLACAICAPFVLVTEHNYDFESGVLTRRVLGHAILDRKIKRPARSAGSRLTHDRQHRRFIRAT